MHSICLILFLTRQPFARFKGFLQQELYLPVSAAKLVCAPHFNFFEHIRVYP